MTCSFAKLAINAEPHCYTIVLLVVIYFIVLVLVAGSSHTAHSAGHVSRSNESVDFYINSLKLPYDTSTVSGYLHICVFAYAYFCEYLQTYAHT